MKPRLIAEHGWLLLVVYLLVAVDVAGMADGDVLSAEALAALVGVVLLAAAVILRSDWYEVCLVLGFAVIAVPFLLDTWVPDLVAVGTGVVLGVCAGYLATRTSRTGRSRQSIAD